MWRGLRGRQISVARDCWSRMEFSQIEMSFNYLGHVLRKIEYYMEKETTLGIELGSSSRWSKLTLSDNIKSRTESQFDELLEKTGDRSIVTTASVERGPSSARRWLKTIVLLLLFLFDASYFLSPIKDKRKCFHCNCLHIWLRLRNCEDRTLLDKNV